MNHQLISISSKRSGGLRPNKDDYVVDVDRSNPILGNKHILHNHLDDEERERVISAYEKDFDADMAAKGPMFMEVKRLSLLVCNGRKISFRCWCAPRHCHGEIIAVKVAEMAGVDYEPPARPGVKTEAKRQMGLF